MSLYWAAYVRGGDLRPRIIRELTTDSGGAVMWTEEASPLLRPDLLALSKKSPMVVELAIPDVVTSVGIAGAAAGMTVYFLRNPKKLGSFLGDVVAGWHQGWTDAERASRQRRLLGAIAELEAWDDPEGPDDAPELEVLGRVALRLARALDEAKPTVLHTEGFSEVVDPSHDLP
jgi:hypothetical protein